MKKTMLIILFVVMFLAGSAFYFVHLSAKQKNEKLSAEHEIMRKLVDDISVGNFKEAYKFFDEDFRTAVNLDNFSTAVEAFPELAEIESLNFQDIESVDINSHSLSILTKKNEVIINYAINKEVNSGERKVSSITISGHGSKIHLGVPTLGETNQDYYINGIKTDYLSFSVLEVRQQTNQESCKSTFPKGTAGDFPDQIRVCEGVDIKNGKKSVYKYTVKDAEERYDLITK